MILTNRLHGAEFFLGNPNSRNGHRVSQHFMEPEDSLPCSQEPSSGPCPEPDESSPCHPILFL
jgi:hypothetical protein